VQFSDEGRRIYLQYGITAVNGAYNGTRM